MNSFAYLKGLAITQFKKDQKWMGSHFEYLSRLSNDSGGKVGERFINGFCKVNNIPCEYKTKNKNNSSYDIIINGKKVEIKTATFGKSRTFQHENLRNNGDYEYILFVDVLPDYYYVSILPKFDLSQKSELLNRTPHLRKGTTDVYKLDFTEKTLKNLVSLGYSVKINEQTRDYVLCDLILKHIKENNNSQLDGTFE